MLELARRLDKAPKKPSPFFVRPWRQWPPESRHIRRFAICSKKSELPVLILYDVHVLCPAGSASIDYVILSNDLCWLCPALHRKQALPRKNPVRRPLPASITAFPQRAQRIYTDGNSSRREASEQKGSQDGLADYRSPEPSSEETFDEPLGTFTSTQSRTYPEIRRAQTVRPADLIGYIKKLFQFDDAYTWVSNTDLYHISAALLTYDKEATDNGDKEEG
jgi:hypothetical protein